MSSFCPRKTSLRSLWYIQYKITRGELQITSDGDDLRIFFGGGVEIFHSGIFWVGKFGKYFLSGLISGIF